MKILIVHSAYQQRGGEDVAVEAETAMLRGYGHDVRLYQRHNDEIRQMPGAVAATDAVWSFRSARDIAQLCADFAPDVIHAHNTFPLISPSLYWAAVRRNTPIVQTLHNFRLICPQAMLLREGRICEDCVGKLPWRAVTRKCYRDSAAQSAVLAGMLSLHRAAGTFRHKLIRYIALNQFCKDKFIEGGLPAEQISIKPNFTARRPAAPERPRKGGLFVGRLAPEKGIGTLIAAAAQLGRSQPLIRVAGSGPLEPHVRQAFGDACLGFQPPDRIAALLRESEYLVAPSACYETFGLAVIEAFSCGTPVIASRHGGLGELVKDGVTGLLVDPSDAADLATKLAWADRHPEAMRRMGRAARAEYEAKYTPEKNYRILIGIYEEAIAAMERFCYAV